MKDLNNYISEKLKIDKDTDTEYQDLCSDIIEILEKESKIFNEIIKDKFYKFTNYLKSKIPYILLNYCESDNSLEDLNNHTAEKNLKKYLPWVKEKDFSDELDRIKDNHDDLFSEIYCNDQGHWVSFSIKK